MRHVTKISHFAELELEKGRSVHKLNCEHHYWRIERQQQRQGRKVNK